MPPVDTSMALEDAQEERVIAWINNTTTHGITLGITPRQEFEDSTTELTLPAVVVKCEVLQELLPNVGNFKLRTVVCLKTQADDTTDATQRLQWHNLRSILMWSNLDVQLNTGANNYTCFLNSIFREDPMPRTEHDRHWEQEFIFTNWACSSS